MRRIGMAGALLALAALIGVLVLAAATGAAAQPNNSEQVVFASSASPPTRGPLSGGFGNFAFGGSVLQPGPFGFWVWCEADSTNPYHTFCNGSLYFYDFGLVKGVFGTVAEGPDGIYTMTLNSADGTVPCKLSNTVPGSGKQRVNITCTGNGSTSVTGGGFVPSAVVNVTGP